MKKRVVALLLTLVILMGMISVAFGAQQPGMNALVLDFDEASQSFRVNLNKSAQKFSDFSWAVGNFHMIMPCIGAKNAPELLSGGTLTSSAPEVVSVETRLTGDETPYTYYEVTCVAPGSATLTYTIPGADGEEDTVYTETVTVTGNAPAPTTEYELVFGRAFNRGGEIQYTPTPMSTGIFSAGDVTTFDYYVLLYNYSRGEDAAQSVYETFWSNYSVEVEIGGEEGDVTISQLKTAADGYHKYVTVTVEGSWNGGIHATATKTGTTEVSTTLGAGWGVTIGLAQKLTLTDGTASFVVENAESHESYFYYIELNNAKSYFMSGRLRGNDTVGSLGYINGGMEDYLWARWEQGDREQNNQFNVSGKSTVMFRAQRDGAGRLEGTITLEEEQPGLLYRDMQWNEGDIWTENPEWPIHRWEEMPLELGRGGAVCLYYGAVADYVRVTEVSIPADGCLEMVPSTTGGNDPVTYWDIRIKTQGTTTMTYTAGGKNYTQSVTVDLPTYGLYSGPVRDGEHYMSWINYATLGEEKEVWVLSEMGFTAEQVAYYLDGQQGQSTKLISVMLGEQELPIVPVERMDGREGTGIYDLKFVLPERDYSEPVRLAVNQFENDWWELLSTDVRCYYEGKAIYLDDYAIGFGFSSAEGDIIVINEGNWTYGTTTEMPKDPNNDRYEFREFTVYAGVAKTDAQNNVYYEVDTSGKVDITVEKMWVEILSGDEGTVSWSQDKGTVLEKTNFGTGTTAYLYAKHGYAADFRVWARVTATERGGETITGDVAILGDIRRSSNQQFERPANDTVADLNSFLESVAALVDPNGEDQTFQVNLGNNTYNGTIKIPAVFDHSHDLILSGSQGGDSGEEKTVINGGIDLGGSAIGAIWNIHFNGTSAAPNVDWDGDGERDKVGIYNGGCAGVSSCTFQGYDVAVLARANTINLTRENVLVGNKVGACVDLQLATQDNSRNDWEDNTFVNNGTAIQILSFNQFVSSYYFRVFNSNFIGNEYDFDLQAPGTIYMYKNYYGKVHPQAESMELGAYLKALSEVNTAAKLNSQKLVTSNSPNINRQTPSGVKNKVVTNPRWKHPVANWWKHNVDISAVFGTGAAPALMTAEEPGEEQIYTNVLVADWDAVTQIIEAEADGLLLDPSAFEDTTTEKQIDVVDTNEELLGTWTF